MYTHHNINNQRFSVRFCTVANYLNFKKVGSFEKLLKQMDPQSKLAVAMGTVRVAYLLHELERYKEECKTNGLIAS